ncbi:hypothetical protein [Stenotrophomonas sp. NPDC078853]|uniref:hypothetical protein n=1 Tax=Stenotrophomonas sp. NPDC078853 TaxID=3364534 RepID=UPI00384C13D3
MIAPVVGVGCRQLALDKYFASFKKPKAMEPNWYSAKEASDAAQRIGTLNKGDLAAALGAAGSPADDLRRVRNFYAHRGQNTAIRALGTSAMVGKVAPFVHELNGFGPGGEKIFSGWIRGLREIWVAAAM